MKRLKDIFKFKYTDMDSIGLVEMDMLPVITLK